MRIQDALELYEISDITAETEESLKSKFRALTKKYHPDNNLTNDEKKFLLVSDAYNELKEMLAKVKQYKALNNEPTIFTFVIPLEKLIEIYGGGYITFGNAEHSIKVDKSVMKKNNSLILSDVSIEHNGISYNFDNIERWTIDDNYNINCTIYVKNITDSEKIKIRVLDKEKEFDMNYQSIKMKFTLQYNVVVNVNIMKKIIVEKEETT